MKKLLGASLVLCLILSVYLAAPLHAETSIWAEKPVFRLELLGILEGDLAAPSKMKTPINREEFAELISKFYLCVENTTIERFGRISPFQDTESKYVVAAYKLGIVKGISESEYAPKSNITREQIATMIQRAIGKMELSDSEPSTAAFADDKMISWWAREGVYFCREDKLVQGIGGNKFLPKGYATREQVVKIIDNALKSYKRGLKEMKPRTETFGAYALPSKENAVLVYSKRPEAGIELRISGPNYARDKSEFSVLQAAQELYEVIAPVWGQKRAKAAALSIRDNWSLSDLRYPYGKSYKISPAGDLIESTDSKNADIRLYYDGAFTVDLKVK